MKVTETAWKHWRIAVAVFSQCVFTILPGHAVQAAEVAGVQIAPAARVGGIDLVLNGAGLRQKFMVDVYILGLYTQERTTVAESVIEDPAAKRIALTFLRDVTAQDLIEALYEGIRDNSSETEFSRIRPAADALAATMRPLGIARKGDTVALDHLPDGGAQVIMNGRTVGAPIPGHDLYRALLRIWLGPRPVDTRLKRALLSGRP